MKRLGVILSVVIFILSSFGFFLSSATFVKAAVSEADYEILKNHAKEFDLDYYTAREGSWIPKTLSVESPSKKYLEFLDSYYKTTKDDKNTTRRTLEVQVLNEFIIYLNGLISKSSNNYKDTLEMVRTTANQKLKYAISETQLEAGAISAEENAQNKKDALVSASKETATRSDLSSNLCKISWTGFSLTACLDSAVVWIIKSIFLNIAGFLLWLALGMFNYVIQTGILEFSKWAPEALYGLWVLVRQIVSLMVVFAGLYLGFMYIVGNADGKYARYFVWVSIFALFVNFSYPLARTAIDVSNIVSLQIYSSSVGSKVLDKSVLENLNESAGGLIMAKLGLQELVLSATTKDKTNVVGSASSTPGALMVVVYVLYAAFIFFMITLMLAVRTAALVFITIMSPLLLVDSVLPVLGEKAKELRKVFFEQLVVGPVFMIMFALTLRFLDVFSGSGPLGSAGVGATNNLANAGGSGSSTVTTFFNILMMLIMLHIMYKVTKHFSGSIGSTATEWLGKFGGTALGAASGVGGFALRNTLGRAGNWALGDHRLGKWINQNQDKFLGKAAHGFASSLSSGSFDLRNSRVVASAANKAGMGSGLLGYGMGSGGSKTSYQQNKEKILKEAKEGMGRIKTHYERDVYKDGKRVHKKGDKIEDAVEAKRRYAEKAGGVFFKTEGVKDEIRSQLYDEMNDNILSELKTKKERGEYLKSLEDQLAKLDANDPKRLGEKSRSIVRTIDAVKQTLEHDQKEFDKQVEDALYKYRNKKVEDREKYLNDMSRELREAVEKNLTQEELKFSPSAEDLKAAAAERSASSSVKIAFDPTTSGLTATTTGADGARNADGSPVNKTPPSSVKKTYDPTAPELEATTTGADGVRDGSGKSLTDLQRKAQEIAAARAAKEVAEAIEKAKNEEVLATT